MPRRSHPWIRLALLLACAAPAPLVAQEGAPARPNIVWISAEDLSPRIGAYGDPLARTPHVDRLAREGVRYQRAFVTNPICAPSRTAIITGMHHTSVGGMHMRTTEDRAPELPGPYLAVPPPHVKAFPEYLRAAGYYTTNNAKTDYQFGLPRTVWDESGPRAHWRNRPDGDQPFFAVFNYEGTHESRVWADAPQNRGRPLTTDPAAVRVPPYYPDTRAVREELARVYDNVAEMDRWVGALLQQLEQDGLLDNTVVFFWTDHGDGLPRAKRWLYDSGLHVPLIVRWPDGRDAGRVDPQLVSLIDLAPTVLELAGVPVPAHLQGRVLVGPRAGPEPRYLFGARDRIDVSYDMIRSVRDRRFKYVRNFHPELPYAVLVPYGNRNATMRELLRLRVEGGLDAVQRLWMSDRRPPEELYDTRADPHEVRNLAADRAHRATLQRMRAALDGWMARTGDQGLIPEAELVQRMWPGGVQPRTGRPYIVPRSATDLVEDSVQALAGPTEVVIYVPTQGASVAYTTDPGDAPRWRLYTGPIRVDRATTIRARAVRYGWAESEERRVTFTTTPPQEGR